MIEDWNLFIHMYFIQLILRWLDGWLVRPLNLTVYKISKHFWLSNEPPLGGPVIFGWFVMVMCCAHLTRWTVDAISFGGKKVSHQSGDASLGYNELNWLSDLQTAVKDDLFNRPSFGSSSRFIGCLGLSDNLFFISYNEFMAWTGSSQTNHLYTCELTWPLSHIPWILTI